MSEAAAAFVDDEAACTRVVTFALRDARLRPGVNALRGQDRVEDVDIEVLRPAHTGCTMRRCQRLGPL